MQKIKPGKAQKPNTLPAGTPPDESGPIRFSFRHLDLYSHPKFCVALCADGYLEKFLCRVRDLSTLSVREFRTNKSPSLKIHKITWSETKEIAGFSRLNSQLRDEQAWQFEITKNEHGRVHGILLDDTFYIVWIDPSNYLYS
jgi:hypothetical protein